MQSLEIQVLTPVARDGLSATSATFFAIILLNKLFPAGSKCVPLWHAEI